MPPAVARSRREATTWVKSDRFANPVSGSCEGLVVQLLLEPAELLERLLQLSVLEGDRGVVRQRLEELEVVRLERADVAEGVGDQERADERRLSRAAGRRARSGRAGVLPRRSPRRPAGRRCALSLGDGALEDGIVERRPDRLHHLDRIARSDLAPQDVVALVSRQEA